VSVKQHYKITALIGLVIGLAFLSKWYPALILLPLWFVGILHCKKQFFFVVTHGAVLLLFAGTIIFPWVVYISTAYPEESGFVLNKFMGALTSPVENHEAEWYYYLLKMITLFGELIFIVLGFSIWLLFKRKYEWRTLILLVWILIPLVVFSFSETKRFTYLLIAAPAFFVLTANFWDIMYGKIVVGYKQAGIIVLLLLLAFLPLRLTIERLKFFEFEKETEAFYTALPGYKNVLDENDVVFGTEKHIEIMFFTDAAAAYVMQPDNLLIAEIKAKGFDVYKMESEKLARY
jgi:4-amino-4-deoxy-L-arabinose transferase